jgi:3-oxoacyl-[acyl-carrier protein] reductase
MARSVFITGAAQGIGAAMAAAFFAAGDDVALLDKSESVRGVASALDASGERVLPIVADVDDEGAFTAAFEAAARAFGGVDVMINNAARTPMGSVWDVSASEWDAVMATNLRSVLFGCRIAGQHMRARGKGGRIVNMASIAGQRGGTATGPHYAASKAGILVLTKIFAGELAGAGVTVNAIAAAAIAGPMVDAVEPGKRAALEKSIPVGRFGRGGEVAAAALYLASDAAAFVTGATLDVNGGLLMR